VELSPLEPFSQIYSAKDSAHSFILEGVAGLTRWAFIIVAMPWRYNKGCGSCEPAHCRLGRRRFAPSAIFNVIVYNFRCEGNSSGVESGSALGHAMSLKAGPVEPHTDD